MRLQIDDARDAELDASEDSHHLQDLVVKRGHRKVLKRVVRKQVGKINDVNQNMESAVLSYRYVISKYSNHNSKQYERRFSDNDAVNHTH